MLFKQRTGAKKTQLEWIKDLTNSTICVIDYIKDNIFNKIQLTFALFVREKNAVLGQQKQMDNTIF